MAIMVIVRPLSLTIINYNPNNLFASATTLHVQWRGKKESMVIVNVSLNSDPSKRNVCVIDRESMCVLVCVCAREHKKIKVEG